MKRGLILVLALALVVLGTTLVQAKVNINTATDAELQSLPGVGPAKAKAIIAGRPYASIEGITKVRGVGSKTLEKWRDLITIEGETVVTGKTKAAIAAPLAPGEKININTASASELQSLRGVGPAMAKAIIAGRPYASIEELTKVKRVGSKTLNKWRDSITVE